ncbi:hypothetical protein [Streptomyces sp. TRM49041]|uniref:hypothetical protein n=1 Tax=Streptomyces sp. TRM49041 TaxID=2603216 RepID=UPI0011ED0C87|nr:hypothetical protein [Streptomyces sp. TRM49041]
MSRPEIDDELRSALHDADSASWSARAAAGRRLASAAEVAVVAAVLHRLLLDGQDTAVTQEAAEALLERWDICGLRMVLAALTSADDDTGDHLCMAVDNVCCQSEEDLKRLAGLCSELISDADATISEEANSLCRRAHGHR